MTNPLASLIAASLHDGATMPFERFVERALYDAGHGFYTTRGRAGGRRGDFVTSVEIGPLFGAVIADWLDGVWQAAGEPAEFRVTEAGAGVGTLFRGINRARPACFEALRYCLVERSAALRAHHETLPGDGWSSASDLAAVDQHVIIANELLDNLPFGIAERTALGWAWVDVGVRQAGLRLVRGEVADELAHLESVAPTAELGARVPVMTQAASWVAEARSRAARVLVFDYGASTIELAERGQRGWLRTYAAHERGSDPLAGVGSRDITCDVAWDQLPATRRDRQAEWLEANGIGARVETARTLWRERSHVGDLAALTARSAVNEAAALTDPDGLGGFFVLEWASEGVSD